jgi:hypothetical protein
MTLRNFKITAFLLWFTIPALLIIMGWQPHVDGFIEESNKIYALLLIIFYYFALAIAVRITAGIISMRSAGDPEIKGKLVHQIKVFALICALSGLTLPLLWFGYGILSN